ncbi:DNA glycosylase AlkZ-like family protein [Nocardia sp. NPDC057227]|uniref:DNA glycosylase AlkZ-like family protein n=1 Tax=Nocardia sp. NPDC057227 TaxID=3346056 RepID=UPI00362E0FD8
MSRGSWLGYRWGRHGLSGSLDGAARADLLFLGVQETRLGTAAQGLRRRGISGAVGPDRELVALWSVRGAPHVHAREDLADLRAAVVPGSPEVEAVASALRAVVDRPMGKGEASAAVTRRLPESAVSWCASCKAAHVPDGVFRWAGCLAGLVLDTAAAGTVLLPGLDVPACRAEPRAELVRAFFRANGPASAAFVRERLGLDAVPELGEPLVPVSVDGVRSDLPESLVDAVHEAAPAEGVALVPPGDPYPADTNSGLLLPEKTWRQQLRRAVSPPGAVLADGEVAGVWRYRRRERVVTVTAFEQVGRALRAGVEREAVAVAAAVGESEPTVEWA